MRTLIISLIKAYQLFISRASTPCCRFYPSCSNYAIAAINKHGALKGSLFSLMRILRCNPFGGSGFDPVPDNLKFRDKK
ncbi:MAG: membrane protein insertion efficiency factor YidD [Pseudomonadota bacterium]|nr:membrane protein insertion efficiency factor YidD [Pseudomonadota bacterium]